MTISLMDDFDFIMSPNIEKLKPIRGEPRWVDFDDEHSNCWGVFGTESGFCYSLHTSEELANEDLKRFEDQQKNLSTVSPALEKKSEKSFTKGLTLG